MPKLEMEAVTAEQFAAALDVTTTESEVLAEVLAILRNDQRRAALLEMLRRFVALPG